MRRKLLTLVTLLSLLPCVVTVVLWLGSYFGRESVTRVEDKSHEMEDECHRGPRRTRTNLGFAAFRILRLWAASKLGEYQLLAVELRIL